MMWDAQTPQGKIYWLSDLANPLIGSPIVAYRLREAAETGLRPFIPGVTVNIDLLNPGNVRFALETMYGNEAQFSENAPEPTEFFDPFDPSVVY